MSLFDGDGEPAAQPGSVGGRISVADVHETVRDQLSEYVDRALSEPDRARVEEHLRSCRPCRTHERTMRAMVRAISDLPREQAPADAKRRLREIPDA